MNRPPTPDKFLRTRRLRERTRAGEELRRLLADGPQRLASRESGDG
jgi:hypothetical protein